MFSQTIRDRESVVLPYTACGSVLDVGCVDARGQRSSAARRLACKPDLLFKAIAAANSDVLGVDCDPEGVEALRSQGYQVECADATEMRLGRRFDTIVAGELIEHVEDAGRLLRNMGQHLSAEGVLILTTPNPFYAGQAWRIWRHGRPAVHEEHTAWYDPITLDRLLRRTGFEPIEGYWVQPRLRLLKAWKRLLRSYFSHSFLVVAKHRPAADRGPDGRGD